MDSIFLQSDEKNLAALKPWLVNFYTKVLNINEIFKDAQYVQYLKLNDIPSGKIKNYAIILVADSDVQIYAKLNHESLPSYDAPTFNELRNSQGSIIKLLEFSISIDKIDSFVPPILIVYKYELLTVCGPPKGKPVWIQERSEICSYINLLRMSENIRLSIEKYQASFPQDLILTKYSSESKHQHLSHKMYTDFKNFSIFFDRLMASKLLSDEIDEIIFSDNIIENMTFNERNDLSKEKELVSAGNACIREIDTIEEEPEVVENVLKKYFEDSSNSSFSDSPSNEIEQLDKNVALYVESLFPIENFQLTHLYNLCDNITKIAPKKIKKLLLPKPS